MASARTGGCLCGAIRYESGGESQFSLQCHCRDCQMLSGTAFRACAEARAACRFGQAFAARACLEAFRARTGREAFAAGRRGCRVGEGRTERGGSRGLIGGTRNDRRPGQHRGSDQALAR